MLRRASVVVLASVVALSVAPRAQSKRFITENDLFKFLDCGSTDFTGWIGRSVRPGDRERETGRV
jgi:hypothetical protein